MNYYTIGQRIRELRKNNALSQEALAEKVGISTTHMSHIETGNTKLSLTVLVNLSLALGVSTDDLLFAQSSDNRNALMGKAVNILEGCNPQELAIIIDILKATKISLSKNL
ncbi:MAG: helix-turn-helix domain-containing protein [Lachnospiraceae bacterium]